MRLALSIAFAALAAVPAAAQTATPTITFYELPAYLGRSVTVTADTPDLAAQAFARRAQSARVTGSWQVCPAADYAGACRTLAANTPVLSKNGVVSVRPTPSTAAGATSTGTTTPTTTAATAAIDLDALNVGAGSDGQDVAFYARPTLGGSEVSAGTNDTAAGTAFCKLAGAASASYAGRSRVQASNLVDVTAKARIRGYALRDVVCRR